RAAPARDQPRPHPRATPPPPPLLPIVLDGGPRHDCLSRAVRRRRTLQPRHGARAASRPPEPPAAWAGRAFPQRPHPLALARPRRSPAGPGARRRPGAVAAGRPPEDPHRPPPPLLARGTA